MLWERQSYEKAQYTPGISKIVDFGNESQRAEKAKPFHVLNGGSTMELWKNADDWPGSQILTVECERKGEEKFS